MLHPDRLKTVFFVMMVLVFGMVTTSEGLLISGSGFSQNSVDPVTGAVTTGGLVETREIIQAPGIFGLNLYNTAQQGFNERRGVMLASDLQYAKKDDITPRGTTVDSHIIFFNHADGDSARLADAFADFEVRWVFDRPILGVVFDPMGRRERDSYFLGAEETIYPYYDPLSDQFDADWSLVGRGMESRRDSFHFMPGSNELVVNMFVQSPGDFIRVITVSAVPEPAGILMMVLGCLGVMVYTRIRGGKKRSVSA